MYVDKRSRRSASSLKKPEVTAEEPGAINDGDEKRHTVADNESRDELERGRLNADVNRRQVKSGSGDDSDTAVVGTECIIDSTRSGSLNRREPVGAYSANVDRVTVMPSLTWRQDIDGTIAGLDQQIVELQRRQ